MILASEALFKGTQRQILGYNWEFKVFCILSELGLGQKDSFPSFDDWKQNIGEGADFKLDGIEIEAKYSKASIRPSWVKRDWITRFSPTTTLKLIVCNESLKIPEASRKLLEASGICVVRGLEPLRELLKKLRPYGQFRRIVTRYRRPDINKKRNRKKKIEVKQVLARQTGGQQESILLWPRSKKRPNTSLESKPISRTDSVLNPRVEATKAEAKKSSKEKNNWPISWPIKSLYSTVNIKGDPSLRQKLRQKLKKRLKQRLRYSKRLLNRPIDWPITRLNSMPYSNTDILCPRNLIESMNSERERGGKVWNLESKMSQ
ncbi:MAG: hypothetical protein QXI39_01200 [Candidatus Bathyarchaeia archaeon]